MELFEAIPQVVRVEECFDGERLISLAGKEWLKMIGGQIVKLLAQCKGAALGVSKVPHKFFQQFGYAINPQFIGYASVVDLMGDLADYVKVRHEGRIRRKNLTSWGARVDDPFIPSFQVIPTESGDIIVPANNLRLRLGLQCRRLLLEHPHCLQADNLQKLYVQVYKNKCDLQEIGDLTDVVRVSCSQNSKAPRALAFQEACLFNDAACVENWKVTTTSLA